MNDVNCLEELEVATCGDCERSDGNSCDPYESESLQYSPDFVQLHLRKDLVVINGKINSMDRNSLITNLKRLNLSINGSITALKKRLKEHYKSKKLSSNNLKYIAKTYPYYVVIDFEATCNEFNPPNYQHEIIEFPAVLVDSQKKVIVDEFHCFCKPKLNPKLSKFCTELTGITQATVNEAEDFPVVLQKFEAWMGKHKLGSKHKYAFVTDGPWDMCRFLSLQCKMSQIQYPRYAKKWINLRKTFSVFYKTKKLRLPVMLESLGSKFEGRQHSGLDDARNIAALLLLMMKDGVSIEINEHIRPMKKYHNYRRNFNATETENNEVEKQDQEKSIEDKEEMQEKL